MNIQDFNTTLEDLLKECRHLLETKGADYSGKEDRFENFKKLADRLGMTKYQVWAVYFGKHIDGLFNAIKNNPDAPKTNSEAIATRIQDAICYLALFNGMLEEDIPVFYSGASTKYWETAPSTKPRETPEPIPEDGV